MTERPDGKARGGSYRHTPPWERHSPDATTAGAGPSPLTGGPTSTSTSPTGPGPDGESDGGFPGYTPPTAFPGYQPPGANPYAAEGDFPSYGAVSADEPPKAIAGEQEGDFVCPTCGDAVEPWEGFCESCGQVMTPQAPMPKAPTTAPQDPTDEEGSIATRVSGRRGPTVRRHPCTECGGEVGEDNYCQVCGAKGPDPRDHYRELPAEWVAGVCDRGVRHHRNEDAMAIAADEAPGSRAVLVVCDGVSTAEDSDVASLAAARTARGVLVARRPSAMGLRGAQVAALRKALTEAAEQANEAVITKTRERSHNASSCTFVAAVVEGNDIVFGNVGDSRAYWIDDRSGASKLLTTDDSVAQSRIAMGIDRETAENGPQAHAITKWLGRDSPDSVPTIDTMTVPGPGWLLVCSDGLWNYASEAEELAALITEAIERNPGNRRARTLAVSLTRWARMKGGKDNITVALARFDPGTESDPADATADRHNGSSASDTTSQE
ncbi:protein phosphatase 2C domain-containing protein [Propionibacteriaceae bacterium Y1685]|uniref:PP2C family protein-serine/threonine phosphatase n=1 Tax=Microlunatus sp. Y1700 TaxID=3418487 RepID=UPI003B821840